MPKHLEDTVEEELTLGADKKDVLLTRCCPDSTFAVHGTTLETFTLQATENNLQAQC